MEKITDRTIIIPCAGMGTRLGLGKPKALIDINGQPLILKSLELLKDVEDIRVVVGFKADDVIKTITSYRKDITFVYNHDYEHNSTGASVCLATKNARKFILTIDGDIIIHPDDMAKILNFQQEFVGVSIPSTDDPVLVKVNTKDEVIGFSREEGKYEWTGVTMLESRKLSHTDGYTYQLVEPRLPLPALVIRQKEVDTPNDYKNAIQWAANGYK